MVLYVLLCEEEYGSIFSLGFFFKQKTAYEMRISDWSSDVCSSDLSQERRGFDDRFRKVPRQRHTGAFHGRGAGRQQRPSGHADGHGGRRHGAVQGLSEIRSEGAEMGRPRPFRAVGGPWVAADLLAAAPARRCAPDHGGQDRKSTRLNSRTKFTYH